MQESHATLTSSSWSRFSGGSGLCGSSAIRGRSLSRLGGLSRLIGLGFLALLALDQVLDLGLEFGERVRCCLRNACQ